MEPKPTIRELRFFQRFHVRTTLRFGVPVFLLLGLIGVLSYRFAVDAELEVLKTQIDAIAVGVSQEVDFRWIEALQTEDDRDSEAFTELYGVLDRVARGRPEVKSIYMMRPVENAAYVRFVIDWVRTGTAARIGELYEVAQTDSMQEGFERPTVESSTYRDAWGWNLSGYAPIRDQSGRVIALVGVDISAARVDEIERRALQLTGLTVGAALVLFSLGGALLGRNLRRPIQRIIAATEAIASGGAPDVRETLTRDDELGLLAARIDRMAEQLSERDRLRAIFGRYVSEEVARRVLESPDAAPHGARDREVTVLFVDIRGYSTISERLEPATVVRILNEYFSAMLEIVDRHGGCVVELLGDAILVVFGAPDPLEDHPTRAVECALEMRARVEALVKEWDETELSELFREHGLDPFGTRTGVHTGSVVAGSVGSVRRTSYTVVGRAVNLAIELEGLNRQLATSILISEDVRAPLPEALAARTEAQGTHSLGDASITVYSV